MKDTPIQFRNIQRGIKKYGLNLRHTILYRTNGECCGLGALAVTVLGPDETRKVIHDTLGNASHELAKAVAEKVKVPVECVKAVEVGYEGYYFPQYLDNKKLRRYVNIGRKLNKLSKGV
jgi:hypothetical protein